MASLQDRFSLPITSRGRTRLLYNPGDQEKSVYYTQIHLRCPAKDYVTLSEEHAVYLLCHQPGIIDADAGLNPLHPPGCDCGCTPYVPDTDVLEEFNRPKVTEMSALPMPNDAPNPTWSRAKVVSWCKDHSIAVKDGDSKSFLLQTISEFYRNMLSKPAAEPKATARAQAKPSATHME